MTPPRDRLRHLLARGRGRPSRPVLVWTAVLVVSAGFGSGLPLWTDARSAARYPVTAADLAGGRAALAALRVRPPASSSGYTREQFGQAWADVDRNGCDTRNDVLTRDLTGVTFKPGTGECLVLSGTLDDPYTGTTVGFARGAGSTAVQIDHLVALSDAWRTGAQAWTASRREQFANDPANLLAVDGRANQDKGDGDAATWLPPQHGYRCVYVLRQVRVKAAYGLWVTAAERDAIAHQLDRCVVARAG